MTPSKPSRREPRRPKTPASADSHGGARGPARARTLTVRWAAVIFAILVVLFFHEVVIGGKTFVSPDSTAPAGFVRIGEQSLYHEHVYPLWNPFVFLGMPSFASGAYNPLIYPPDWPVAVAQKLLPLPELTWMLLYYFLGGVFFFLLARDLGARAEGALLGAVAFVFAPNLIAVGSHGHGSQLVDSMYLPLMLWLTVRWMRDGRLADLGWIAIAGGFQLLRGHVQICFYTWMAVVLYAVAAALTALRDPAALRARAVRLGALFGAGALAFGISAFYSLPLRDYAHWSIRGGSDPGGGVGMDYATAWSFAPYELPSIVVPGWVGFGGETYWGGMPFTDYPNAYVGIITILFCVPAVFATGWARGFALALGAFALVVAFGKNFPFYGFLYQHLPLFNKFRVPVMIVVLFQLAASLGLAWGWSTVLESARLDPRRRASVERLLLALSVALIVAFVVGVIGREAWRGAYVANAVAQRHDARYTAAVAGVAYTGWVIDLARACVLGLLALGAGWLALRGRAAPLVASGVVLALLMIELWPVSGRLMVPVIGEPAQRNAEIGRDDAIDFLEKAGPPGTFRILPVEELQGNRFAGFGIASVGGYHAAKPKLVQDFLGANLVLNVNWMRLLNVRYIVTRENIDPLPPFLKLAHAGTPNVYENLDVMPRATLVSRIRVVEPASAILDSIARGTSDSRTFAFLEKDPGIPLGPAEGGAAVVSTYKLNEVVVDVDAPGPALLRLADAWYPDWVADVDGKSAPIHRVDYLLRAVPVPAGKHRVVFHFRSPAVDRGLAISLGCFLASLALLAAGLIQGRRKRSVPAEPTTGAA